jgi:2-oxoglutarate ferredoxin oxidoreductase subunit beta
VHKNLTDKEFKADNTITLRQGEKMLFGKENNKGIALDGWHLKVITIGEDGYTLDDVLVHDATTPDNTLHLKLAKMELKNGFPVALGVIRNAPEVSYDEALEKQISVAMGDKKKSFRELMLGMANVWEVK